MTYLKGQDHDGLLDGLRDDDCTTAVEERLSASLARERLIAELESQPLCIPDRQTRTDVQTLLEEVDDLNRRLREATHAMQKAVSAIDNEQYHARIRAARSYLDDVLEGLVHEFGIEG